MAELTGALIVPIDNVKKKLVNTCCEENVFCLNFRAFLFGLGWEKAGIEGSSGFNAPFDMRSRIN